MRAHLKKRGRNSAASEVSRAHKPDSLIIRIVLVTLILMGIATPTAHANAPTVTALTFTSDSILGGTLDTITGTNLAGAISVTVGGVAATLGNNTSTSLEFYIPAGTVGTQSVVVTTAAGSVTSAFSITYYETLTPACSISGSFTINRNNSVVSNSACKGTAVIPSGVKSIGSSAFVSNANMFFLDIPATLTSFGIANNYGPFKGSGLTGVTFQPNSQLTTITPGAFRETPRLQYIKIPNSVTTMQALSFSDYVSTNGLRWIEIPETVTAIDMTQPYGAIHNFVPLTCIVTPVGSHARTLAGKFTTGSSNSTAGAANPIFVTSIMDCPAPTISSISSAQGSSNGGVSLTINGTNMWNVNSVTIGGVQAQITSFPNTGSVTVLTPAGSLGAKDIVVSTPGPSATSAAAYTYVPAPTITSLSVTSGPVAGGTVTVITGTNLGSVTAATLGGTTVTRGTNTSTSLTITTPASTAGAKTLSITNANGTVTLNDAFTYVEQISSFSTFAVTGSPLTVSTGSSQTVTATVAYASKVTFRYRNVRIPGCISLRTPTTSPFTITCTWKVSRIGAGQLTATSIPNAGGINTGIATPINLSVVSRSTR